MTRNAVILALVCALAGALFYSWNSESMERTAQQKNLKASVAARSVVFYAVRDIAAGAPITRTSLRSGEELSSEIPQNAVEDLSRVIGRKTRYGLSSRQLLSYHDLVPNSIATVVTAVDDVHVGAVITADDIDDLELGEFELPKEGFTSRAYVVGKKAKREISKGSLIVSEDLEP